MLSVLAEVSDWMADEEPEAVLSPCEVVGMRTFRGDEGEAWLAKAVWSRPSPSALAVFESAKSSASASGVRKGPPRCAARPWAWDMADSGCRESRVSTAAGGGGGCGGGGYYCGGALRDSARVEDGRAQEWERGAVVEVGGRGRWRREVVYCSCRVVSCRG